MLRWQATYETRHPQHTQARRCIGGENRLFSPPHVFLPEFTLHYQRPDARPVPPRRVRPQPPNHVHVYITVDYPRRSVHATPSRLLRARSEFRGYNLACIPRATLQKARSGVRCDSRDIDIYLKLSTTDVCELSLHSSWRSVLEEYSMTSLTHTYIQHTLRKPLRCTEGAAHVRCDARRTFAGLCRLHVERSACSRDGTLLEQDP